jgi:hypothetical protein
MSFGVFNVVVILSTFSIPNICLLVYLMWWRESGIGVFNVVEREWKGGTLAN